MILISRISLIFICKFLFSISISILISLHKLRRSSLGSRLGVQTTINTVCSNLAKSFSRRQLGLADCRLPQRPDLADLFPAAVMDEYTAAPPVSDPLPPPSGPSAAGLALRSGDPDALQQQCPGGAAFVAVARVGLKPSCCLPARAAISNTVLSVLDEGGAPKRLRKLNSFVMPQT